MPESVHAPHPVEKPNLARKFPLTGTPVGLMAALITRLADHLPIRRLVRELATLEPRAGADQGDQAGCADRAPAGLGGLDEPEGHRHAGGAGAGALGDPLAESDGGEG